MPVFNAVKSLDDMTEKTLHDRTEGRGFSGIEPRGPAVAGEFPFRGSDMPMDYRQPGFAFASPAKNVFTSQWKSFVQGVECKVPERFTAPDGYVFGVKVEVRWQFKEKANPVHPPSEPTTRKFARGAYLISGVEFLCAAELPAAESIAYDGNYLSSGKDIFGNDFEDTETLVVQLGVVTDGSLVRSMDEGNLFFSRFSRGQSTVLVLNP